MSFLPLAFPVVVDNLDIVRSILFPKKADAELVVDTDAVLSLPVSPERFQAIARRDLQIGQVDSRFHLIQFPKCYILQAPPTAIVPLNKELARLGILEALDHGDPAYDAMRHM
jgi:hypothetical protein